MGPSFRWDDTWWVRLECASPGCSSAVGNRRDLDFDAAVLRPAAFVGVGGDRIGLALALDVEAALVDALVGEDGRDRDGAALREVLVVRVRTGIVGVAGDVDDGLVEF